MAGFALTLKGAVHHGPLPAASTSRMPATASMATRLQDSAHPVTLLPASVAIMSAQSGRSHLTNGSMVSCALLDRPMVQACTNANILVMLCSGVALLHVVPVVELSLHKPWAGGWVGRKPQRVESAVSSCTAIKLSLRSEVFLCKGNCTWWE